MATSNLSGFDKVYCYPNSNTLKNKLNIKDPEKLRNAERDLTYKRMMQLESGEVKLKINDKTFGVKQLQDIHKHIFQDVYPWAGQFRTVDIAKSNLFCRVMFMNDQLNYVMRQLKADNYLQGITDKTEMGNKLGYYLSEINAVHPFREGNGRTQRMFIQELAHQNGYHIDYSKINKEDMLQASIASFDTNYEPMQKLITNALSKIDEPDVATMTRSERMRMEEAATKSVSTETEYQL